MGRISDLLVCGDDKILFVQQYFFQSSAGLCLKAVIENLWRPIQIFESNTGHYFTAQPHR